MKKEDLVKNSPALSESQILSDEMLESIESGACKESCKKTCVTNMNGTYGGGNSEKTAEKVKDTLEKVADKVL